MGQGVIIQEVSRSHTTTQYSRWGFSRLRIDPSQRSLAEDTQQSKQTSMPPVGFEPTISASEEPQTYALDHAPTGTGDLYNLRVVYAKV